MKLNIIEYLEQLIADRVGYFWGIITKGDEKEIHVLADGDYNVLGFASKRAAQKYIRSNALKGSRAEALDVEKSLLCTSINFIEVGKILYK